MVEWRDSPSWLRDDDDDESADARRILTAVPQSDWKRPAGRPHTSWLATMKNDLSYHNISVEDATELALDRPLWRLLELCTELLQGKQLWWWWWWVLSHWKYWLIVQNFVTYVVWLFSLSKYVSKTIQHIYNLETTSFLFLDWNLSSLMCHGFIINPKSKPKVSGLTNHSIL